MSDFYIDELLDNLEDNRRAIEIYTLDITQPDEEYALTQEEKDRTIKMLKEYYRQANEKEKILESILEEAQGIYRNYTEIIRQEKVMIEDAFEELNIPLDESLNENKKKKNYLKQLQDYANKHQKGLGRFTKYGGKTNTNAGNVEVNNAFFNSVASSNSGQAMGNGGQAMGEKLTLCEDKIDEKELAQLSSGLYEYFTEKDLYVEDMWWLKDDKICYSISWGDWKHEHGRSTYLAQEYLYEKGYYIISSEQEITEDDGSDTYSSIHYLEIEPIGIKESLNESYVIVGVDKDDHKRKFYDTDSKEWTEDETKATKFEDLISSQETWKDIDKEQFEKTFIPIYDKKEDVNNENK